ncbi:hypothetical protein QZH41_020280 [Actinostola sp. cb2023]|nr:hypothetical protein QZH41_020280 [Actinostola sp. cb2023]
MNIKILLLLCLITILVLPDAEAWGRRRRRWFRVRRIVRRVCSVSCKMTGCRHVMVHGRLKRICHRTCGKVCHKVFGKKRDEDEIPDMMFKEQQDEPVFDQITLAMPSRLPEYDTNEDGRISTDEFSAINPQNSDMESTASAFDALDTNGDKYIDCPEFLDANMHFDDKPTC